MPEVPTILEDCSTEEQIAALLYLGWTHEEIAAVTNVSKGTVQNRRRQLEGGDLHPPPEVFDLIRTREREVHRLARSSELSSDRLGTEIADRISSIADLDALDIGPSGEISYEELVAFGVLIAGQVAKFSPQEVVNRLAPVAVLIDHPSGLSESVFDPSRQRWADSPELDEGVTKANPSTDTDSTQVQTGRENLPEKPVSSVGYDVGDQNPSLSVPDSPEYRELSDEFQLNEQTVRSSREPSTHEISSFIHTKEECQSLNGIYDDQTGECRYWPPTYE